MNTTGVDFDFARYIQYRKGLTQQRARDGSQYAYVGERKVRRALVSAKPVSIALEAMTRLWKKRAKRELLDTAIKANDQSYPELFAATRVACRALRLEAPPVYVAPSSSKVAASALGTDDDAYVVVNADVVGQLSDEEMVALVGHELGHIQNNHVLYATALHYLRHDAMVLVRWAVQPAIMALQAWARRAEITCDRAALIATGDLDMTLRTMVKSSLGFELPTDVDADAYLADLPDARKGLGKYAELFRSDPYLPKRVRALQTFANSRFFLQYKGEDVAAEAAPSADATDAEVAEILSVF